MSYSRARNTVAFFSSVVALLLAAFFCFLRIGFDNFGDMSLWSVLNVSGLSWFILLFPANLRRRRGSWQEIDVWGLLLGLSLVVGVGVFASFSGISLVLPFVFLGIIFFGISLFSYLKQLTLFRFVISSVLVLFYSLWLIGLFWGQNGAHPLFYEGIFYGFGHIDILYHSAIVGMLKTFSVVSTGLDGIPYEGYHFASHWIFAQISSLLKMRAVTFYQLGFPVIFIPLFINAMLLLILDVRRHVMLVVDFAIEKDFFFWFLFVFLQIGFLPNCFYGLIKSGRFTRYSSQSYTVALFLSLLLISTLIYFWKKQTGKNFWTRAAYLLFFAPFFVGLIALTKISVGFLLLAAGGYFLLAKGLYKQRLPLLGYIFTVLIFAVVYFCIADLFFVNGGAENMASLDFFQFFRGMLTSLLPFWLWFYYLFAFISIGFQIYNEKVGSIGDFFVALRQNRLIGVEVLMVFCVVGFLPLALLYIPDDGALYFSDYQGLLAILFLLACLPFHHMSFKSFNFKHILKWKLVHVFVFMVLLPGLITALFNTAARLHRAIETNIDYRLAIVDNKNHPASFSDLARRAIKVKSPNKIIKMLLPLYSADSIQNGLKDSKEYGLMQAMAKLSALPIEEKRKSLLFIPGNDSFWELCEKKRNKLSFVVPAVAEMAMLDGLPPLIEGQPISYKYYSYRYAPRTKPQRTEDIGIEVLCRRVRGRGFSKLLILDSNSGKIKDYDCEEVLRGLD